MGIGAYAAIENWKQGQGFRLENVFDVIFNLAFLLIILGGIVLLSALQDVLEHYGKICAF